MAITALQLMEGHAAHTVGAQGVEGLSVSGIEILNDAGEYYVSMHRWRHLERRQTRLAMLGPDFLTNGNWVAATKTLTATAGTPFVDTVAGDIIEITGGIGVTAGKYQIVTVTSSTVVVLFAATLSAVNLANADIAGSILHMSVALPLDFGQIQAIDTSGSMVRGMYPTTKMRLLELRSHGIWLYSWSFHYVLSWRAATGTSSGPPVPILEIYPAPQADDPEGFTLFYRAKWRRISTDTDFLDVPEYAEPLFKQIVRAFTRGYEEEDIATMNQRLAEIEQGPMYTNAMRADGHTMPDWGPIQSGAAETSMFEPSYLLPTEVSPP